MITVTRSAENEWLVTVKKDETTEHRVRVTKDDVARFAEGRSVEDLLQESFRFLLEHEPNTSILGSFDLPLIGRYFPDYPEEIRKRLRQLE